MKIENVKERIKELRQKIRKHNRLYYIAGSPKISDREYDRLYRKLKEIEEERPEYITADSPTQRVGGKPLNEFKNYTHTVPMLSLDNTYSRDEIVDWEKKISKKVEIEEGFIVEEKLDGIGLSLVFRSGNLDIAATRGDGYTGDEITANIKPQRGIPLKLSGRNIPGLIEIRGEVFIRKSEFKRINERRRFEGKKTFANPRNTCAGTLKLLDPEKSSKRQLNAYFYAVGAVKDGSLPSSQEDILERFTGWGLPVNKNYRHCRDIGEIKESYEYFKEKREDLDYEIDGIVIKVSSRKEQNILGSTAKSPRWAIAYKFEAEGNISVVKEIKFNVSRTGKITPVAKLEPVKVGGVEISSATLYNFDYVREMGIKPGDRVEVKRGGDVIPKITSIVKHSSSGEPVRPPDKCPSCGLLIQQDPGGVYYRCVNINCPAQLMSSLVHYAGADALDIDGLGESVARQLTEGKYVKKLGDIYELTKDDLMELELFGEKRSKNLVKAIGNSGDCRLDKFIYALGIRQVGTHAAEILAEKYESIENFLDAGYKEIEEIDEIGPVTAEFIIKYIKSNAGLIRDMLSKGVKPAYRRSKDFLGGVKIVITGKLEKFTRKEATDAVKKMGGRTVSSVSPKTDILVRGENPGSKLQQAWDKRVKIISEEDFINMIGENS